MGWVALTLEGCCDVLDHRVTFQVMHGEVECDRCGRLVCLHRYGVPMSCSSTCTALRQLRVPGLQGLQGSAAAAARLMQISCLGVRPFPFLRSVKRIDFYMSTKLYGLALKVTHVDCVLWMNGAGGRFLQDSLVTAERQASLCQLPVCLALHAWPPTGCTL